MARKGLKMEKKTYKRERSHEVKVRLNDDELAILNGKVKIAEMHSREQFIRELILMGYVYEVDYKYLQDFNFQISRLGHNIDQILKRINIEKTGIIYERQIKEIKEALEKVWQLQQYILSQQP
ncbi:MAG: plasmid mobilization relaxosome protein MobC [Lachnospiraceae bacterium]|nr:plasmid mobilization relaxosome protein MobC [Lachnospiraceae bacterium]